MTYDMVFKAVCVAWPASEFLVFTRDVRPVSGIDKDGGSRWLIVAVMIASIVGAVQLAGRFHRFGFASPAVRDVGLAFMVAGIVLRQRSVHTLGEFSARA